MEFPALTQASARGAVWSPGSLSCRWLTRSPASHVVRAPPGVTPEYHQAGPPTNKKENTYFGLQTQFLLSCCCLCGAVTGAWTGNSVAWPRPQSSWMPLGPPPSLPVTPTLLCIGKPRASSSPTQECSTSSAGHTCTHVYTRLRAHTPRLRCPGDSVLASGAWAGCCSSAQDAHAPLGTSAGRAQARPLSPPRAGGGDHLPSACPASGQC